MSRLPDLAERIERLLLRQDELVRTHALLEQQVKALSHERGQLKARLATARSRVDALLQSIPGTEQSESPQ